MLEHIVGKCLTTELHPELNSHCEFSIVIVINIKSKLIRCYVVRARRDTNIHQGYLPESSLCC